MAKIKGPLIRTDNGQIYYSPSTKKIIQIPLDIKEDQIVFEEINHKFAFDSQSIRKRLRSGMESLVLENTQSCNLRCAYCVYGGNYIGERRHSNVKMNAEIAGDAVNYFLSHSQETDKRTISFYGGEPFLNFGVVETVLKKCDDERENIDFAIATNGTLIEKYANFLIKNNIKLAISLDGPKRIHDRDRLRKNGKGSFKNIVRNLELLRAKDETYFCDNIILSSTLSNLDGVFPAYEFFTENFPDTLVSVRLVKEDDLLNKKKVEGDSFKELDNKYLKMVKDKEENHFLSAIYDERMLRIFERGKKSFGVSKIFCVPGISRLFVDPKGDFYVCEKLGQKDYKIGDVEKGVIEHKVLALLRRFQESSNCEDCWTFDLCNECLSHSLKDGMFSKERVEENCDRMRKIIKSDIALYYKLADELGDKFWEHLQELKGGKKRQWIKK